MQGDLSRPIRAAFLLFRGWCIAYRRRGWPATDGAGVLAGDGSKAGNKVGSAPCNSLAVTLALTYAVHPWELRRFDALRGVGYNFI